MSSVETFLDGKVTLFAGDCLDVLATLPEASVDAVVTDPPAGIAFMGREWDRDKGGRDAWIAWMTDVAAQCLRVIKPGGHALVWALPRTSHWTATAWEDAGWDVRDRVIHIFGSGFPKSMDISKQLDKAAGAEREVVGNTSEFSGRTVGKGTSAGFHGDIVSGHCRDITAPSTEAAKQWDGWGTALKPAAEDWWLLRKPLIGTVAQNVLTHGVGGLAINACRVMSDTTGTLVDCVLRIARDVDGACGDSSGGTRRGRKGQHDGRRSSSLAEGPGSLALGGLHGGSNDRLHSRPANSQGSCLACRDLDDALAHFGEAGDLSSALRRLCVRTHTRLSMSEGGLGYAPSDTRLCECMRRLSSTDSSRVSGLDLRMVIESIRDNAERLLGSWWMCTCTLGQERWTSRQMRIAAQSLSLAAQETIEEIDKSGAGSAYENLTLMLLAIPYAITNVRKQQILSLRASSRWPSHVTHDGSDEVLAGFPDSAGQQGDVRGTEPSKPMGGGSCFSPMNRQAAASRNDSGSAARFFYCAKGSSDDRVGSRHPTVKNLDLMQWLIRLVTPRGGTVLDCFAGSGTTGEAAWREGMRAILIEKEPEFQADIARRMDLADNPTKRSAVAKTKNKLDRPEDLPLFGGGS